LKRFAGHGGCQGFVEIVARALEVGLLGGGFVVDGALIDELAGGVDDEDVWGGFGFVEAADGAVGIEERGGRCGVHGLEVGVLLCGGHVALLSGCGRDDGEPDDALGGPVALLRLDAAAEVVFAVEGTALVGPFEYDEFPAILGERVLDAVGVGAFEVGGAVAGDYSKRGSAGEGECEEKIARGLQVHWAPPRLRVILLGHRTAIRIRQNLIFRRQSSGDVLDSLDSRMR
jgi:hypothetical protein